MSNKLRWSCFLLKRWSVHVIFGAIVCAAVGAILTGLSGALVGYIVDTTASRNVDNITGLYLGARVGTAFGSRTGGIAGAFAWGIVGILGSFQPHYLPHKAVVLRTLFSMAMATVIMMSSYLILNAFFSLLNQESFTGYIRESSLIIAFLAPLAMGFGVLAGAGWGFKSTRQAKQ